MYNVNSKSVLSEPDACFPKGTMTLKLLTQCFIMFKSSRNSGQGSFVFIANPEKETHFIHFIQVL